jgi:hypothetical protein
MVHECLPYVQRQDGYEFRLPAAEATVRAFWRKLGVKQSARGPNSKLFSLMLTNDSKEECIVRIFGGEKNVIGA